jgi:hypothetical protein
VLEVLLEITKFCDLYLMERVLDDESEVRADFVNSYFVTVNQYYIFAEVCCVM